METEAAGKVGELHTSRLEEADVQCPTCDVKIKRSDMAEHYKLELERLQQQNQQQTSTTSNNANDVAAASSTASQNGIRQTRQNKTGEDRRRQPLTVFQRVQRNRQTRQKQRTRKRSAASPPQQAAPSEAVCPICSKSFPQSEIQVHANLCLRQIGQNSSDEDDDSDEATESDSRRRKRLRYEYTTMGHLVKYKPDQLVRENDDDEDLNVDEDDTEIYGPAQYSETDVIPLTSTTTDGSGDVTDYMRRLISSGDTTTSHSKDANASSSSDSGTKKNHANSPSSSSSSKLPPIQSATPVRPQATVDNDDNDEDMCKEAVTASTSQRILERSQPKSIQYYEEVIESLKSKLKLYESEIQSKFKCLICIDDYKNPAISVSCWHVYCEQCWLRTLGARKLCPQCSSITTTKDLRRIYL